MGLEGLNHVYVVGAHWITFLITFILLLISTILLETSLSREVTDDAVCSEGDISNHYWKTIQTVIVGSIIVCHLMLEVGFFFYIPISDIFKSVSKHIRKSYSSRSFYSQDILGDLCAIMITSSVFSIAALPCVLELSAIFDVIKAEINSEGNTNVVNKGFPESRLCCGSTVYTHGMIPNYSAADPPSLNFVNEIFHCRVPSFPKDSSTPPCCCFEPTRAVSYLNLAAYNIFIMFLRLLFWSITGFGAIVMISTEKNMEVRRRTENAISRNLRRDPLRAVTYLEDHNHNRINGDVAYHVNSHREPTTIMRQPRGVGKFTCAPGQTRDQVKHDILMARQRQPNDLIHLAYTFHSCVFEYWMNLSLSGVTVSGAHNVHQIDIQNFAAGKDTIDVLKDSRGGFVVAVLSGDAVKGLLLTAGADALPNPLKVEVPILTDARIEIRAPRMPLPNVFEERKFLPGDESMKSLKLGGILIECRLDVYLGAVQTVNELFSGRSTNIKLGIRNYSKNDSIRTETTAIIGGIVLMVIKNSECHGVAFIHAPKKVTEHVTILPGKDSTNSDYFVSLNFRDK